MSAVTSLLRLTRPARGPRGPQRFARPPLEPVVAGGPAGVAEQAVDGIFAELIRALDGAFVPLGGAIGPDASGPERSAMQLTGPGLSARGALAWTCGGRTRLSFGNPVYSMAQKSMRACVDGAPTPVTLFRLDTAATHLDVVDTRGAGAEWAPRLTGTVAVLAPAGAAAFNAAFGTTAFPPGLRVGEVSFRL